MTTRPPVIARLWPQLVLVAALAFAVFFPSLSCGFTNFDDHVYVPQNRLIKELSLENLKAIFSSQYFGNYHPLTMLGYAVQYRFFGMNPTGYHAVNLAIHILSTAVLLLLARRLAGPVAALVCTLLFSLHPLRVESVTWIAELKDVLFVFFYLCSLLCYVSYLGRQRLAAMAAVFVLFVMAMLSKATAISLPAALLLLDFYTRRPWSRKIIWEKIPLFLAALIFVKTASSSVSVLLVEAGQDTVGATYDPIIRVLMSGHALFTYLLHLIAPFGLACVYAFKYVKGVYPAGFIAATAAVAAVLALAAFAAVRLRSRAIAFCLVFFLLTIFPHLPLLFCSGVYMADRYSYIPSVGLCFLAGLAADRLFRGQAHRGAKIAAAVLFALYVAMLALLSFERCHIWKNSVTLWSDTIEKFPETAMAYNNRGLGHQEAGREDLAMLDFDAAVRTSWKGHPTYSHAFYNKARILFFRKEYAEALRSLDTALYARKKTSLRNDILLLRGLTHESMGHADAAIADFTALLEQRPDSVRALSDRGILLVKKGEFDRGIGDLEKALALDPQSSLIRKNLEISKRMRQQARAGKGAPAAGGSPPAR